MIRTETIARALPSDAVGHADAPTRSLASWYTQGRSDGFGDRLLMFDNTGAPSLELLRFRPELTGSPAFERALRDRAERLSSFKHPAFPNIRAVEHLEGGEGLALVSTYAAGKRLSDMFEGTRPRPGLHPAFAVWLIRELTPALADLQRFGPAVAHAALNLDRVVLSPDGALIVVEHALGSGLNALEPTTESLWTRFGLLAPATEVGAARLDRRTDVVQLAVIVASVLLGRRLTPTEYPRHVDLLLDECREIGARRSPSLAPHLCQWLERALRLDDRAFTSAEQARDGLRELPDYAAPAHMDQARSIYLLGTTPGLWAPPDGQINVPPDRNFVARGRESADEAARPRDPAGELVEGMDMNTIAAAGSPPRRFSTLQLLTAGLALVAMLEGALSAWLYARSAVPPLGSLPMVIESAQPGDVVIVDGRQAGVTPLAFTARHNTHSIRVVAQRSLPEILEIPAIDSYAAADAARSDSKTAAALAQAAARQRSGGVRLATPIELQVVEGERVLGSSANGPIVATAGVHELDLINGALGYRARQRVTIKAGQIISLTVSPPDGRLSINASPWAQVWIDGRAVGETPLANVAVPVGEHEITFRHPQLGERRETALVKSGALTRVSATLGR